MNRPLPIALALLLVSAAIALADRELSWPAADKLPKNVKLHAAGKLAKEAVVEVSGPNDKEVEILVVDEPKAPHHRYMLKGKVKYKGVGKEAYVEMWSHFPDDNKYFSRTLSEEGPTAKIQGDSDWREIVLPFVSKEDYLPTKLVVNVVLPGEGTIYLTTFTLMKLPDE